MSRKRVELRWREPVGNEDWSKGLRIICLTGWRGLGKLWRGTLEA
jgi:hypothetical protein